MKPIQPGERVSTIKVKWEPGLKHTKERFTGLVEDVGGDGCLLIKLDQAHYPAIRMVAYFTHCRRLVKKERRRVWIPEVELRFITDVKELQARSVSASRIKVIESDVEFIEVRKKS